MQHSGRSHWLAMGLAVAITACATTQPRSTTTTTTTTRTASGDVALLDESGGMWVDSTGGLWMDTTGTVWMGGSRGMRTGLLPADIASMNNQNIVAHLAAGDSLEIALSRAGAERAQNPAVRDFAQRMVTEHSAHLQAGLQMAAQAGITPAPAPADTADAAIGARIMSRLAAMPPGPDYDRQLMRAEVMMHRHMLNELTALQPQASGAARQLIDQTIPVVQQHLADARTILRQVGGTTTR